MSEQSTHENSSDEEEASLIKKYIAEEHEHICDVDLNDYVNDLLNSKPSTEKRAIMKGKNDKQKRNRKNQEQVAYLEQEFEKSMNWSKRLIASLSKITGLSESQVYKWNWDTRKKLGLSC